GCHVFASNGNLALLCHRDQPRKPGHTRHFLVAEHRHVSCESSDPFGYETAVKIPSSVRALLYKPGRHRCAVQKRYWPPANSCHMLILQYQLICTSSVNDNSPGVLCWSDEPRYKDNRLGFSDGNRIDCLHSLSSRHVS